MSSPVEQFAAVAASVAVSAAQTQLGQAVTISEGPRDVGALEVDEASDPKRVTGHFVVAVDGTPGSMTATLAPSPEPEHWDLQLTLATEGSDEAVVFTATLEDTPWMADAYQALVEAKRDPGEDTGVQNTVA